VVFSDRGGAEPLGNFAPTLLLFDVLLGTFHAPHAHQDRIGVDDGREVHWSEQLYWPIVRRSGSHAALDDSSATTSPTPLPRFSRAD
jgi:hypothetical protein